MVLGENHAHIILDARNYKEAVGRHKAKIDEGLIREKLKSYSDSKITFIRDGGDNSGVSAYAKKLADEYEIKYISPIYALYKKGNYGSILGKGFKDIEEYKKLLSEIKRSGADFVKLMASGILDFSQFGLVTEGSLSFSEMKELINIAHNEGFSVMVHVNNNENIINAVMAGADSIEHGFYIRKDTIDAIKENDTVWVPTITAVKNLLSCDSYDKTVIANIVSYHEEMIKYAFETGANVALGSDAGAYMVEHVKGIHTEYQNIKQIINNDLLFKEVTEKGQEKIIEKFCK